jgi:hypothetical protein
VLRAHPQHRPPCEECPLNPITRANLRQILHPATKQQLQFCSTLQRLTHARNSKGIRECRRHCFAWLSTVSQCVLFLVGHRQGHLTHPSCVKFRHYSHFLTNICIQYEISTTSTGGCDSTTSSMPTDGITPLNLKSDLKAIRGRGDEGHNPEQPFAAGSLVSLIPLSPDLCIHVHVTFPPSPPIQRSSWA